MIYIGLLYNIRTFQVIKICYIAFCLGSCICVFWYFWSLRLLWREKLVNKWDVFEFDSFLYGFFEYFIHFYFCFLYFLLIVELLLWYFILLNIIFIQNIWFWFKMYIFSWFVIIRITQVDIVLHFRLLNLFILLIAKVSSLIRSITTLEWFIFLSLKILLI